MADPLNPDAPAPEAVSRHRGMLWTTGIAAVLIGLFALVYPLAASIGVSLAIGAMLAALGVVELIRAFRMRRTKRVVAAALFGGLAIVAGVILMLLPETGVVSLTILLIAYLLAGGVLRLVSAWQARDARGAIWLAGSGVLSLALGVVLWAALPGAALWALGLIFGIDVTVFGFAQIALAMNQPDRSGEARA